METRSIPVSTDLEFMENHISLSFILYFRHHYHFIYSLIKNSMIGQSYASHKGLEFSEKFQHVSDPREPKICI